MRQQASRARRHARYEAVHALAATGVSERQIAHRLGIARGTVRTFLQAEAFPERALRPAASIIDAFVPYLHTRWEAGCTNASQLWREIHERGYPGTRRQVARWAQQQRGEAAPTTPRKYIREQGDMPGSEATAPLASPVPRLPSPRKLAWLLVRAPSELRDDEQTVLERIQQDPRIGTARALAQQFQAMVRNRAPDEFDAWLAKCRDSALPDLQNFAEGLQRDRTAVLGALTETWSNGQAEGQITRLKLLKRQMYGRAKLDLLRKRVLHAA
jgi:transposase